MNNAMSKRAAILQIPVELLEIRKMNIYLGLGGKSHSLLKPFQNETKL